MVPKLLNFHPHPPFRVFPDPDHVHGLMDHTGPGSGTMGEFGLHLPSGNIWLIYG